MKYKMITSDFDDTLLRSDNTISQRTKDAIVAYVKAGGVFTISTGRMHESIQKRLIDAGIDNMSFPLISFQGALVTDSITREHIYEKPMDKELALAFARECERMGLYYHCYSFDTLYVKSITEENEFYCKVCDIEAKEVGDLIEFIQKTDIVIAKMLVIESEQNMPETLKTMISRFPQANIVTSNPRLLEIVNKDAGKGNTLLRVAKSLGIKGEECIAIGDSMNDYSMIEAAGLGVAVDNACDALKKIAGLITTSNNEEGVAKILEDATADIL